MTNEAIENLLSRRSVRKYEDRQITDDELDTVLKAGLYAPSAMNRQSTVLVAVRDRETRDLLSAMNAKVLGQDDDPFYGAPCVVVVLGRNDRCIFQDGSLVLGNMMNAAKAIGLGSCWINRATEMFETPEGKALLAKWGLDEGLIGIGNCILGYPAEDPEAKPRADGRVVIVDENELSDAELDKVSGGFIKTKKTYQAAKKAIH